MTSTRYKGFKIETRPYQNQSSRQWTLDLEIHRNGRKKVFSVNQHCPTEREADARCTKLGREIIDGVITGWSVDQLRPVGFLQGDQDGHPHRLAASGNLLKSIAIFATVAGVAVAFLTAAFRSF